MKKMKNKCENRSTANLISEISRKLDSRVLYAVHKQSLKPGNMWLAPQPHAQALAHATLCPEFVPG